MIKQLKKLGLSLVALSLAFLIPAQALAQESSFAGETVSVGVVGDLGDEIWRYVADKAEKEAGIKVEVTLLTDYNQPNEAVMNGSLNMNAFQHVAFLNDWNEANDGDLVSLGYTFVTEMGIFSNKVDQLEDLQEGATIAIPNDPTNGGRALLALELAGLIEVDDAAGILATPKDVTANPHQLKFEELDAHQVAQSLPDVDAGVLGTGLATDAGISIDEALFVDTEDLDQLDEAYRNVIAVRQGDRDNPLFQKIVELFQSEDVAKVIDQASQGGAIPAW
ncbi:MetQ/NlpA family ABC transporter substrate-binding protein [Hutsoniella sourekii]